MTKRTSVSEVVKCPRVAEMGRNKIAIEKIKDEVKRKVTFIKRSKGLFKKCEELAILTSSEVGVIIFSSSGKLFQYCNCESMGRLLKRYYDCQQKNDLEEVKKEKEQLQLTIKRMMGEELSNLEMKELQELESQLRAGMSRIEARKNEIFLEKIGQIEKRDHHLQEENQVLRSQLIQAAKMGGDLDVGVTATSDLAVLSKNLDSQLSG